MQKRKRLLFLLAGNYQGKGTQLFLDNPGRRRRNTGASLPAAEKRKKGWKREAPPGTITKRNEKTSPATYP
jgi:hypothetical protein